MQDASFKQSGVPRPQFKTHPDHPGIVVRESQPVLYDVEPARLDDATAREATPESVEITRLDAVAAREAFTELGSYEGINLPSFLPAVGPTEDGDGHQVYMVTTKVEGQVLSDCLWQQQLTPERQAKLEQALVGLTEYFGDKAVHDEPYLQDATGSRQYMIGTTMSDADEKLYFVDLDPIMAQTPPEETYGKGFGNVFRMIFEAEVANDNRIRLEYARQALVTAVNKRFDEISRQGLSHERQEVLAIYHQSLLQRLQ